MLKFNRKNHAPGFLSTWETKDKKASIEITCGGFKYPVVITVTIGKFQRRQELNFRRSWYEEKEWKIPLKDIEEMAENIFFGHQFLTKYAYKKLFLKWYWFDSFWHIKKEKRLGLLSYEGYDELIPCKARKHGLIK